MDPKALEAVRKELQAKRDRAAELKARNDGMIDEAVKDGSVSSPDFIAKYEEATKEYDGLKDEIVQLDDHLKRMVGEQNAAPTALTGVSSRDAAIAASWGDRLAKSEVYARLKASGALDSRDARINTDGVRVTAGKHEVKNLITSGDYPLQRQRDESVAQRLPLETVTILDMISIGQTDTEIVEWVKQTLATNNAGSAAEGVAFAESDYKWEVATAQVQEVGHYAKTTKRALRDEGQLRTLVDQDMVDGLRAKVQALIISGAGTGTDFTGLLNTEGIGSVAFGGTDKYIADTVHRAMTTIRVASKGAIEPTAIGIHPNDWQAHVLAKDENNNYINGGPNASAPRTMWGLTPIVHVAFPEGNPLVGDFKKAKLWIWSDVALSFTDSNEDDFLKRLVAVMASFGAAFGVPAPLAFCEVDLSTVS